MESDKRS